jgi:hypothetical protein
MKLLCLVLFVSFYVSAAICQATPTAPPPPNVPVPPPAVAAAQPDSSVSVVPSQLLSETDNKSFDVVVKLSPSDGKALVTCQLSGANGGNSTVIGVGSAWIKSSPGKVNIKPTFNPNGPVTYTAACRTQTLTAPPVPPFPSGTQLDPQLIQPYGLASKVKLIDTVAGAGWDPKFSVNSSGGTLELHFVDTPSGVSPTISAQPSSSQTDFQLPLIPAALFTEGIAYRYTLDGKDLNGQELADSNAVYVVQKVSIPKIAQPISLTSADDGLHISFTLTSPALSLQMVLPPIASASQVEVSPTAQPPGGNPLAYEFVIPTAIQNIWQSGNSGSSATLSSTAASIATNAQARVNSATGQGSMTFTIVDAGQAPDSQTIAKLTMSVTKLSTALINAVNANPPGLKASDANTIAKNLLGANASPADITNLTTALSKPLPPGKKTNNTQQIITTTASVLSAVAKGLGFVVP